MNIPIDKFIEFAEKRMEARPKLNLNPTDRASYENSIKMLEKSFKRWTGVWLLTSAGVALGAGFSGNDYKYGVAGGVSALAMCYAMIKADVLNRRKIKLREEFKLLKEKGFFGENEFSDTTGIEMSGKDKKNL